MLVSGVADPVDARVVTDHLVHRIDHDALVPLVDGVLGDPVRVQHTEGTKLASGTLLSNRLQVTGSLDLGHTRGGWLTVADSLGNLALASSTLHTDTVHNVSLLGLVAQSASLVWTSRTGRTMDGRKLTELPCSHTGQESADITLFLLPELLEILVSAHFGRKYKK